MLKREKNDLRIREMRPADLEALMQIKNAENWNQTEEDWLFLIKNNPKFCLVAVSENKLIGTVTAMKYQQKLAWIGMMLVAKKYRGLGVSKILLNTILKRLDKCDSIKLDATPAGVPVYKKLGFVAEYEIDRMVSSGLPVEILDHEDTGAFEISNISLDDINKLMPLDKIIFGVGRLDLFDYLLNNQKKIGFQIKEENILKGFVFGREGSNYLQIGPLLAESIPMAKFLFNAVFNTLREEPLLVDVLADQREFKEWLLFKKFKHERSFTRMYLKTNDYSGKKENLFLISGPELG
jgi:GNAT superfamily N-acetyltransferase